MFAGVVFEGKFRRACADDVHRVTRLAVVEDDVALGEFHRIEVRGEGGAFLVVEELEKRDFGEQGGFGGHKMRAS